MTDFESPLFKKYLDVDAQSQDGLTPLYIVFVIYFIGLGAVAVRAYLWKQESHHDEGKRKSRADIQAHYTGTYHPYLIALTVFSTAFSGYTVAGVPATTLKAGYYVLQFFAGTVAQSIALLIFFPRLRRIGMERGYLSPTDFIADRYRNSTVTTFACIASCTPQFIYLAVQLASFGETVNTLTRGLITKLAGTVFCAVFMLLMEFLGGMHSVVLSDIVQACIMLVGFLMLFFVLVRAPYNVFALGNDEQCQLLTNATETLNCKSPSVPKSNYPEGQLTGCLYRATPSGFMECSPGWFPEKFIPGDTPPYAMNGKYFWFVFNFFAFPLNPHLVQRVYLAEHDSGIKSVVKLLLFSPFFAMGPGVLAGVVLLANYPEWGAQFGCGSAFGTLAGVIARDGQLFEKLLIAILSSAALAAIMSSADSVILGVSNTVCIDLYRNMISPDADGPSVVRLGQVVSLVMAAVSSVLAMQIEAETFINWLGLQNGILLQLVPAVLLGLYTNVSTRAVRAGFFAGFATLIPTMTLVLYGDLLIPCVECGVGEPNFGTKGTGAMIGGLLEAYIAAPALSFAVNMLVARCVHGVPFSEEIEADAEGAGLEYACVIATRYSDGEQKLRLFDIVNFMKGHIEPKMSLIYLSLVILPFTVPFLPFGGPEDMGKFGIVPIWAFFVMIAIFVDIIVLYLAASSWQPKDSTPLMETEMES